MNGHDDYRDTDIVTRRKLLSSFLIMLWHLPIRYVTLLYRKSEYRSMIDLSARLRRDIVNVIFDHLDYFQSFDNVKVYYDDGQNIVTNALHHAFNYALARNGVVYLQSSPTDYVLEQAANLICTIEYLAVKYANQISTPTDQRFFGGSDNFKRNYLKKTRKLMLR